MSNDSTHQECMVFARIGHGPCYYHWNEIFADVAGVGVKISWVKQLFTILLMSGLEWRFGV